MTPRFYFSVCQAGAEKAMREEVLSEFPHLKFAFSRPGFVTFKEEDDQKPLIKDARGIFTRLFGQSIGQAKTSEDLEKLIAGIPEGAVIQAFERDQHVPGDEPDSFKAGSKIQMELSKLKSIPKFDRVPVLNQAVYDLIWLDEGHVFLGKHIHRDYLDPAPGNAPVLKLPTHSPSRAYLKIAEALHRIKPEIHPGLQVLEVGCSPGGATTCMMDLGCKVTGIDPKFMDKKVMENSRFQFVQKTARSVTAEDLKGVNPEWLVLDMNLAPLETLDELGHVLRILKKVWGRRLNLQAGFLTIKLNDWKFASDIPLYLRRIHELGFQELLPFQLCSNRQEFFVYVEGFEV
jgi:23S rRNA (cytidine2498-2'-O)-methyltransferase